MKELWKPILNLNYEASNFWFIRHIESKRIKSVSIKDTWYCQIAINKDWKTKSFSVHRLVASAFLWLDITDSKIIVRHKNDIRSDNRANNLELWTQKDNVLDMMGRWRMRAFGDPVINWSEVWTSKLIEKQVYEIKLALSKWETGKSLAKKYSVSTALITSIRKWASWSHVKLDKQLEQKLSATKLIIISDIVPEIIELTKNWDSFRTIAKKLWTNPESIWKYIKRNPEEFIEVEQILSENRKHTNRKLSNKNILEIVKLWTTTNLKHQEIADRFWIARSGVWRILAWKNYSSITGIVFNKKPLVAQKFEYGKVVYWKKKKKNLDIDKMCQLYAEWLNTKTIANLLNYSEQHISQMLYTHINWYKAKWGRINNWIKDVAKTMIVDGVPLKDIAKQTWISLSTLKTYRKQ